MIQRHRARGQGAAGFLPATRSVSAVWKQESPASVACTSREESHPRRELRGLSCSASRGAFLPWASAGGLPSTALRSSMPAARPPSEKQRGEETKELPRKSRAHLRRQGKLPGAECERLPPSSPPVELSSWLSWEQVQPCNEFNTAKRQKVSASCFSAVEQT